MTKDIKDKSKTTRTEKSIFEKLEKYLKNLKSHGCLQTHPPILEVLKEMNTKLDDAMNVKVANEKLATKVTLLEKRINEFEFDKYRNSVHINNLAVTAKKDN